MEDRTDKVAARMARIERRKGYAEREARHFELWEKQMGGRKEVWNAMQFDREHERLMRQAVEGDHTRA